MLLFCLVNICLLCYKLPNPYRVAIPKQPGSECGSCSTPNHKREDTLKHTLSVVRADLSTLRSFEERRRPINSQPSRLKDLATLFIEQFKRHGPSAMLHQSATRFQESYSVIVGEYEVKLQILTYNERDNVPSVVREPETVAQIHRLRSSLVGFVTVPDFELQQCVYEMPIKAFVMCGEACVFSTDIDEGVWSLWLCDRKNRTSACVEITHTSLVKKKPRPLAKR